MSKLSVDATGFSTYSRLLQNVLRLRRFTVGVTAVTQKESSGLWSDAWRRLKANRLAMFGLIFLAFEAAIAILTPWIAPHPFDVQSLENTFANPSMAHWLGTDALGRDVLSRLLFGSRISLMVGFLASMVSVIVGVVYGAVAGWFGGKIDSWMMRIVDVMYALPFIFLVIILMVYFGRDIRLLFLALGLTQWLTMARIARGQVLGLKRKEFVEAAVTVGVPTHRLLSRHIIPNAIGPVIVYLTLTVPAVILEEAFLSFLGLGVQPPHASWGSLISSGVEAMEIAPRLLIAPAIALSLTLFSLNFLGDGLRDALDPKGSTD